MRFAGGENAVKTCGQGGFGEVEGPWGCSGLCYVAGPAGCPNTETPGSQGQVSGCAASPTLWHRLGVSEKENEKGAQKCSSADLLVSRKITIWFC